MSSLLDDIRISLIVWSSTPSIVARLDRSDGRNVAVIALIFTKGQLAASDQNCPNALY